MAKDNATKPSKGATFKPLGNTGDNRHPFGIMASVDTDKGELKRSIPFNPAAVGKAPLSKSQKSKLVGNTAGWTKVPGVEGLSINVCAAMRCAAGAAPVAETTGEF